jgi:NADPH:quinone reductase-like Zn-dependent oxidoreductase
MTVYQSPLRGQIAHDPVSYVHPMKRAVPLRSSLHSSGEDGAVKAIVRDRWGGPEVVRLDEIPTPEPAAGEVLVRVHAASVNRADLDGLEPRPGFLRVFLGIRGPRSKRVGIDVAGTVEKPGDHATRFKAGDRVFTDLFTTGSAGSFAEYIAVPERVLQPIPDGMSFEIAATLPHSSILALQGLRTRSGQTVQPGSKVLIGGASGNVGPFAVQIAKHLGAEVTGVARTEKLDFVRSLGADHVIDYTITDYTATGDRYDWIVDTDSHQPIRHVRRALRDGGRYLSLGGDSMPLFEAILIGPLLSLGSSRRAGLMLWWKPFHAPDVATVTELVESGAVTPRIDRRYPLSETADALRWVDDGHAKGKVVITIA